MDSVGDVRSEFTIAADSLDGAAGLIGVAGEYFDADHQSRLHTTIGQASLAAFNLQEIAAEFSAARQSLATAGIDTSTAANRLNFTVRGSSQEATRELPAKITRQSREITDSIVDIDALAVIAGDLSMRAFELTEAIRGLAESHIAVTPGLGPLQAAQTELANEVRTTGEAL